MNPDLIEFYVPNWNKHNAQHKKGLPWIKLQTGFFHDEKVWPLSSDAKMIYLYCLILRADGQRFLIKQMAVITLQVTLEVLIDAMAVLFNSGLLTHHEVTATKVLERERERDTCAFDFESIYLSYPRKVNNRKQFGMNRLMKDVQTPKDYDDLVTAMRKYRDYASDKEERFIKQFATWAGEWREWVNFSPRQRTFLAEGVGE